jgi:hypothetical protein
MRDAATLFDVKRLMLHMSCCASSIALRLSKFSGSSSDTSVSGDFGWTHL